MVNLLPALEVMQLIGVITGQTGGFKRVGGAIARSLAEAFANLILLSCSEVSCHEWPSTIQSRHPTRPLLMKGQLATISKDTSQSRVRSKIIYRAINAGDHDAVE